MKILSFNTLKNYFYPLTKRPPSSCFGVSDLFFWRRSSYSTYFDLIDVNSLILSDKVNKSISKGLLCLFDPNGSLLSKHTFVFPDYKRKFLDITSYLDSAAPEFGTFSIFNISAPGLVDTTNSFRSDRGYTFYSYKNSDLLVSVHGNLDAVALTSDYNIIPLSSALPVPDRLNIQYLFHPNSNYDLCFTNPSNFPACVYLNLICATSSQHLYSTRVSMLSLGSCVISLPRLDRKFFIRLSSRLVLPRPLIFSYSSSFLEVFHA